MSTPEPPPWPHCAHGATPADDPVGCRGIHIPGHTACLAHLTDTDRVAYLASLTPGADIDHRGTPFTTSLLHALLAALHDSATGTVRFGNARFESAAFERRAGFESATFHGDVLFESATFHGDVLFESATFYGNARFESATFKHRAGFKSATFHGEALFESATFHDGAHFDSATFKHRAGFESAAFAHNALFRSATFHHGGRFESATFKRRAGFKSATFHGDALFESATFQDVAGFQSATFEHIALFRSATFHHGVRFESATFHDGAHFQCATFKQNAAFESATFEQNAAFESAIFTGNALFRSATFKHSAGFKSATFHSEARFHSATLRGASFESAAFKHYASFEHATFYGRAWFQSATFHGGTRFESATFTSNAQFGSVTFERSARFRSAVFQNDAWFVSTTFMGESQFSSAIFHGDALFASATFERSAGFESATFMGDALFASATFERSAGFESATFMGDALFRSAIFAKADRLGPLACAGQLVLSGATFGGPVTLWLAARRLECRRTRWAATAEIRLRYTTVDFAHAVFEYPLTIAAEPDPFVLTTGSELAETAFAGAPGPDVRLVSLRGVDAAHLVLADVDLSPCLFTGTVHLDQLRLEGACTFDTTPPPAGWRRWPPVRFTRRRVLAEEHHWRARRPGAVRGWNVAVFGAGRVGPLQLAPVYRALRKAFEDGKHEPGAADFYYGEMEMRRHADDIPRAERWLLTAYWALSGYGLRASRALAWLGVGMILTIGLLMAFGIAQDTPKQTATGTVPPGGGTVTFEIDKDDPKNPTSDRFSGERFEKALNVTLNSVVFRSSGQDLTTAGTYIEMASRLTEPVLLGLAVLAIRNRVKR